MNELVSIIMPAYNAEKYIGAAIESVLRQTWRKWELIIVDDGSEDGTAKLIENEIIHKKDCDIRLLRQPCKGGAAEARNRGLREAKGRYIAYLDADDLWMEEKLEKEIDFMRSRGAAFAFTGYEFMDEHARRTGKVVRVPETLQYRQALSNTTIFTTTVMFDTEKISRELLEMPHIKSEDTALWWKILRNGYTACGLNENLALYRRAGKTLSSNKLEAICRIWRLYRDAEGLGIARSAWHFCFWAVRAVKRRV